MPDTYVMEAKENYSAALAADFAGDVFPELGMADGATMGLSFDLVRGKIMYVAVINETSRPIVNTTGHTIWDGAVSFINGATITAGGSNTPLVSFVCEKDIVTGVVTFYPNYLAANLVPAGIGGGDGTWRRFTNDFFYNGGNMPNGADPRTGNFWVSSGSCELYLFRLEDDFSLIISPIRPQLGDVDNLVQLVGITEDWVYAKEANLIADPGSFDQFYLTPRLITADETTADELLIYATYDYPLISNASPPTGVTSYYRQAVAADGALYVFSMFCRGPREYKLWKFTPPSAFVYPTPPVDGGFSDITPWAGATGPNVVPDYEDDVGFQADGAYKLINWYLPATNVLVLIAKYFPADLSGGGGTQADFQFGLTYYDIDAETFDQHTAFVGPYMTAGWAPTDDPDAAAYAPKDCREVNPFLDINDFEFDGVNYAERRLFFRVVRVVAGVETGDLATVIVVYTLAYGVAPVVVSAVVEDGWDAAYPAYAAAISDTNVVQASMQPTIDEGGDFSQYSNTQDSGIWDGDAYWWAGSNANMFQLDADFTNRAAAGTDQPPFPPFLRLSFDISPPLRRYTNVAIQYQRRRL